jgi:hypothetical protein
MNIVEILNYGIGTASGCAVPVHQDDLKAGTCRRIQFLDDIGKKQDSAGIDTDCLGNALIGSCFPFLAGVGIKKIREIPGKVAVFRMTEEKFLCLD